jgi:hypothetical protein
MYIQYVGFDSSAGSRIYSFHVIDIPEEARDFTVGVQAAGFRPDGLKFQDGPDICFARLAHELEKQTPESRAAAHLSIGELDIKEYLEHHHPQKPKRKKREEPDMPATDGPKDLWRWR